MAPLSQSNPLYPITHHCFYFIVEISASNNRAAVDLANALPPAAGNKAPTSASLAQVEPFNEAVRYVFHLMLNARKNESRERITASKKERAIRWLTESIPERLDRTLSKKRS